MSIRGLSFLVGGGGRLERGIDRSRKELEHTELVFLL
jgi:hypothetical protein